MNEATKTDSTIPTYDDVLRACFHEVTEITPPTGADGAFRVVRAEKPIPQATKKTPAAPSIRRAR